MHNCGVNILVRVLPRRAGDHAGIRPLPRRGPTAGGAVLFSAILLLFLFPSPSPAQPITARFFHPNTLHALILSGRNNHDWRTTTPFLKQLLLRTGRFDVRVNEEPSGTTAGTLAAYDVLILDYQGPRWGAGAEAAVESFVRSGKGMVAVHAASWPFSGLVVLGDNHVRTGIVEPPWPQYAAMIGGVWSEDEPKTGHGKMHSFPVKFIDRAHPIAAGLAPTFIATDELYHNMRMRPEAKILATAFDDAAYGGTGRDEPILWTVQYGKGRVFHTTLGHDVAAMMEPGFGATFTRGAEWAASGKVAAPLAPQTPPPLRDLVVTCGHTSDTSFYTLFDGYDDIHWSHAVSNHEAFRSDLRDQYDAVVLYDYTSEIAEGERRNLRDYLESGKGLVVMHHAIADYQDWPWWYREVVGGKYLLKPEGDAPASTYKEGVEVFAEVAAQHPVTAGVGPLHFEDELYKGLWISPEAKPLLKTDSPLADKTLAWVSPYPKARVVYIEPGHGHAAHRNPSYRKLVYNAIRWTARRD